MFRITSEQQRLCAVVDDLNSGRLLLQLWEFFFQRFQFSITCFAFLVEFAAPNPRSTNVNMKRIVHSHSHFFLPYSNLNFFNPIKKSFYLFISQQDCFCSVWQLLTWFSEFYMLSACISHEAWKASRVLRPRMLRGDSDDLMVLGHADMFNKYCLRAAPSIPFLSRAAVFYGGTPLDLLILLPGVCSHQQNIWSFITLYCYGVEVFVITIYVKFAVKHANMFCLRPVSLF